MDTLNIALHEDKTAFAPGQTVEGTIRWSLQTNPEHLEFSLFWYTAGKGTRDVGVVETARFDNPGACGSKESGRVRLEGVRLSAAERAVQFLGQADLAGLGARADLQAGLRDRPPGDHALADGPGDHPERGLQAGQRWLEREGIGTRFGIARRRRRSTRFSAAWTR